MPDHVLYSFLFHRIDHLEALANQLEHNGRSGASTRAVVRRELGLTSQQMRLLKKIASEGLKESQEIDEKASQIISQIRAKYPPGRISRLPEVPPDIYALQAERNNVFLKARHRFQAVLDSTAFEGFEARLRSTMNRRLKYNPLPSVNR